MNTKNPEVSLTPHKLTSREQRVIRLRFGFVDGRNRTLEEIGREFNVTRERIRQIETDALLKLRHPKLSRHTIPTILMDRSPKSKLLSAIWHLALPPVSKDSCVACGKTLLKPTPIGLCGKCATAKRRDIIFAEFTCEVCGTSFLRQKTHVRPNQQHIFCSRRCMKGSSWNRKTRCPLCQQPMTRSHSYSCPSCNYQSNKYHLTERDLVKIRTALEQHTLPDAIEAMEKVLEELEPEPKKPGFELCR